MTRRFRALVGLAVFFISTAAIFVSDIFIRGHHIQGTDPHSWDVFGSLGIGVGLAMMTSAFMASTPPEPEPGAMNDVKALHDLLTAIFLYCNWAWITKNLTTEQRELWADVLDDHRRAQDLADGYVGTTMEYEPMRRWWRVEQ